MSGCQGNLLEKGTLEMERVKVGQVGRATCRVSHSSGSPALRIWLLPLSVHC